MRVISNTSPLLNLAIIGQLALVRQQFDQVWIPPAVLAELQPDAERPGSMEIREALRVGWLCVSDPPQSELVSVLRRELDSGEAEAIALAVQWHETRVLLDERDGRRVARSLGLAVTGALGVLLRAKLQGELASLRVTLDHLETKAGFRLSEPLRTTILREAGEVEE
jgi:predicted nucleic acid-binding protein